MKTLSLLWAGLFLLPICGTAACQGTPSQPDTSPHTEHRVAVNGITLHYLDWGGKGEPLVFLTGYGSPAHVFDALAPRFTPTFRVVALTRRGLAPSDAPPSGYDIDALTADIKGLLDVLKFERAHLVAHSFGGTEATHLASAHPNRVASIVYLDAALDPAAHAAVMKEAPVQEPQPAPGTPFAQVLAWFASYSADFSKLQCPALAFYAVPDNPPIPPAARLSEEMRLRITEYWRSKFVPMMKQTIEKFRREAPTGRVVVFENASHYLFLDREADVVRDMTAFYSSIRR